MIYLDSTADSGSAFVGFLLIALLLVLYFLPTIVAALRHHHNTPMIAILNFFLGWTLLGWIIFLAMSFSNPTPQTLGTVIHNYPIAKESDPKA